MSTLDDVALQTPKRMRLSVTPSGNQPAAPPPLRTTRVASAIPLLLIDATMMTRECITHMLRTSAREFAVESVARASDASMAQPQIILLNIKSARVSDPSVLDELHELRQRFGNIPVAVIADRDTSSLAIEAIRHGLRGYVPTSLDINIVVAAIRLVLAGGTFVPEGLVRDYAHLAAGSHGERQEDADEVTIFGFTSREGEVLRQLQQGKANKVIAYELNISESTVKVHVRNIMKKLHATNRTQVAFLASNAPRRSPDAWDSASLG